MTTLTAARIVACALTGIIASGCGSDEPEWPPLASGERAVLERAFARALEDSLAMAGASFSVPVELETTFGEDDSTVTVRESFTLTKRPGSEFAAVDRRQDIVGDRDLLNSMYSFENSKGELRSETEARFSSVGFGADERRILDDLLDARIGLEGPITDAVTVDGEAIRTVHFAGEDMRGTLELDRATLAVRRVSMRRKSSSLIGGYDYEMTLHLTGPSSRFRLPVRMTNEFSYRRIGGSGSGIVQMSIDTTALH